VKKLDEAKDWTAHRLEKLTGYPYYKLRAGDYRAIITWNRGTTSLSSKQSDTGGISTTVTSRPDVLGHLLDTQFGREMG
jgi:hypothetical protein